MYKLVVIRHGESLYNQLDRFTGWVDSDLSPEGIKQAQRAGHLLRNAGYDFDVAYTSNLIRARHTLECVLAEMGLADVPVITAWQLNERHYGALEGLSKAEAARRFGAEAVKLSRRSFSYRPPASSVSSLVLPRPAPPAGLTIPETESMADTAARCVSYWESVVRPAMKSGKRPLIVTHGDVLRLLTGHLMGLSDEETVAMHGVGNAIPVMFEFSDGLALSRQYVLD